jgi:hypothetical protein
MAENQAQYQGWSIVELMGHQREIGHVTTEYYGAAALFRVDSPELPEREFVTTTPETGEKGEWIPAGSKVRRPAVPARSRLVAPGSLYAINPCTEEAARAALEHTIHRPLILIEAGPGAAKALARATEYQNYDDDVEGPF